MGFRCGRDLLKVGVMARKEEIKLLVCEMINLLSEPLTPDEIQGGWNDKTRLAWIPYYKELLQRVELDDYIVPLQDFHVSRMLDMSGVMSGELSELAARISNALTRAIGWTRGTSTEPKKPRWTDY
jgi:hypothetical protein